jgi:hypothetical protein
MAVHDGHAESVPGAVLLRHSPGLQRGAAAGGDGVRAGAAPPLGTDTSPVINLYADDNADVVPLPQRELPHAGIRRPA